MNILELLGPTLMYSTPIIFAALGGLYCERSGIVNIALEGIMLVGAFSSVTAHILIENSNPWISILIGGIAGAVFSVLHAIASVTFKANQVISGTALNILSGGITVYLTRLIFDANTTDKFGRAFSYINVPFLGDIYPTFIFAIFVTFVTFVVLKYTKFGLRLKSCGEYPQAADSVGINVYFYRYVGVILSGVLAGIGGGVMVLTQNTEFNVTVIHGMGFIALAALIFGKWDARWLLLTSLFFGFTTILQLYAKDIAIFKSLPLQIFKMLPYVATIIALVITSGKSIGPKAAGEIYDKGKR